MTKLTESLKRWPKDIENLSAKRVATKEVVKLCNSIVRRQFPELEISSDELAEALNRKVYEYCRQELTVSECNALMAVHVMGGKELTLRDHDGWEDHKWRFADGTERLTVDWNPLTNANDMREAVQAFYSKTFRRAAWGVQASFCRLLRDKHEDAAQFLPIYILLIDLPKVCHTILLALAESKETDE